MPKCFFRKICLESFWLVRKNTGIKFLAEFLAEIFSGRSEKYSIDLLGKFAGKKFSEIIDLKEKKKIVASTGNAAPGNSR